ncbi:hypothetical protein PAXRUDRAFT_483877 [Paxillus rubicundulus Ve08.2h10]|uniref:Uncharacterized protein n=1 Tax=Paxillus rubicundulus Ve08.2h10 TaxID=930991 RepID=A0A0D0DA31_9AGAM|nr:hypothetical protein PAXRUDRAFT_483877 [Paxillus rubicundulus Ve08.2h10]
MYTSLSLPSPPVLLHPSYCSLVRNWCKPSLSKMGSSAWHPLVSQPRTKVFSLPRSGFMNSLAWLIAFAVTSLHQHALRLPTSGCSTTTPLPNAQTYGIYFTST